jgi:hypothetical protein
MTFLNQFVRACLRILGLDGDESPRLLADILLGALAASAALILLAYSFERHPVDKLRLAALVSAVFLALAILLAKNRLYVISAIVAFIGVRGAISFALFGYWSGLFLAFCGAAAVWLAVRLSQRG